MTTIYDVAARASVSPATVSRVFNGGNVSVDKQTRVWAAAKELGFVPNRNARRLRTRESQLIAMMVPDIENPFFTTMVRAVEDVARAAGYSVMLCNTDEDPEREDDYLRAVVGEPVAGIIIAPSKGAPLDIAIDRSVPVVCTDRASSLDVDSVVADNIACAFEATRLLRDAGYRRIACVTGDPGLQTAEERAQGWQQALDTLGDNGMRELRRVPFTVQGAEVGARELLDLPEPPDAIFAANNRLAIGVLRVLMERGLQPPAVGVASLGELPLVTWQPREIIVTHLPARELGTTAATMLLERIRGLDAPPRHVVIPAAVTDDQTGLASLEKTAPALVGLP